LRPSSASGTRCGTAVFEGSGTILSAISLIWLLSDHLLKMATEHRSIYFPIKIAPGEVRPPLVDFSAHIAFLDFDARCLIAMGLEPGYMPVDPLHSFLAQLRCQNLRRTYMISDRKRLLLAHFEIYSSSGIVDCCRWFSPTTTLDTVDFGRTII
jgi:hypothetical protein